MFINWKQFYVDSFIDKKSYENTGSIVDALDIIENCNIDRDSNFPPPPSVNTNIYDPSISTIKLLDASVAEEVIDRILLALVDFNRVNNTEYKYSVYSELGDIVTYLCSIASCNMKREFMIKELFLGWNTWKMWMICDDYVHIKSDRLDHILEFASNLSDKFYVTPSAAMVNTLMKEQRKVETLGEVYDNTYQSVYTGTDPDGFVKFLIRKYRRFFRYFHIERGSSVYEPKSIQEMDLWDPRLESPLKFFVENGHVLSDECNREIFRLNPRFFELLYARKRGKATKKDISDAFFDMGDFVWSKYKRRSYYGYMYAQACPASIVGSIVCIYEQCTMEKERYNGVCIHVGGIKRYTWLCGVGIVEVVKSNQENSSLSHIQEKDGVFFLDGETDYWDWEKATCNAESVFVYGIQSNTLVSERIHSNHLAIQSYQKTLEKKYKRVYENEIRAYMTLTDVDLGWYFQKNDELDMAYFSLAHLHLDFFSSSKENDMRHSKVWADFDT